MPSASIPVNTPSFISTAPTTDISSSPAAGSSGSGNTNGNSFQDLVNLSASQNQNANTQTTTSSTADTNTTTTRTSKRQDQTDTTAAATSAAYYAAQPAANAHHTPSKSTAVNGSDTAPSTAAADASASATLQASIPNQFNQMEQLLSSFSQSLTGSSSIQQSATTASPVNELSAIQDLTATLQQLEQSLTQSGSSQSSTLLPTNSLAGTAPLTNNQIDALLQRIETDVNQLASFLPLSGNDTSSTDISSTTNTSSDQILQQLLAQATNQRISGTTGTSNSESTTQSSSANSSASANTTASPAALLAELQSAFATLAQQLQSAASTTTTTAQNTNVPNPLAAPQQTPVTNQTTTTNTAQTASVTNQTVATPQQASNDATPSAPGNTTPVVVATSAATTNPEQASIFLPITTNTVTTSSAPQTNAGKDKDSGAGALTINDAPILTTSASFMEIVHSNSKNSGNSNDPNQGQSTPLPIVQTAATTSNAVIDPKSSFSSTLANASTSSILDQVTVQIKSLQTDGSNKISIQLQPAELGKLEIKLNIGTDGKTNVTVTADNKSTLDLLRQDSQGLTRALNDAGLSTNSGSLNFNLRGGQQQNGTGSRGNSPYKIAQIDTDDEVPVQTPTQSYVVNLTNSLDIQI